MKYSIEDIRREYNRLDSLCGINTESIEIRLNNASRRLGCFSVRQEAKRHLFEPGRITMSITVSKKVMDDDTMFFDTIRHEYAHAVVYLRHPKEHHVHDSVWKQVCREVGCAPRATVKNEKTDMQREKNAKYMVVCNGCGAVTYYLRAGNTVSLLKNNPHSARIICRKCGGKSFSLTEL